jgi:tetratricopeptide (TPR) repeat protein
MYHDFDPVRGFADPASIGGIAMIVVAGCVFVATLRRKSTVAFAVAWMAVTTLPYLWIRWPQLNVFAERYLYLPSIGLFLLAGTFLESGFVGAGLVPARFRGRASESMGSPSSGRPQGSPLHRFGGRRFGARSTVIAATTVLSILGILTIWQRTPDWRDDMRLYTKTLTQSRRAVLIRNNLAVRLLEEKRFDEGIRVLQEVADTPAATSDTWHNMGLLRAAAGDDRGAVLAFRRARRYGIPKLSTVLNLGYMYDRVGQRESAVETYMQLVDRAPDYVPAWFNLAMIAFAAGQYGNARAAVDRVLQLSPDDQEARALQRRLDELTGAGRASLVASQAATKRASREAMRQARRGRYREAMTQLRAAAWLNERAPLPHQYLANIAALRGDSKTALAESREALQRSPGNPLYRRNVDALEKKLAESGS